MSKIIITKSKLEGVASKIRSKSGATQKLTFNQMESELDKLMQIPTETLDITENGDYEVIDKAYVNVNVEGSGGSEEKGHTLTLEMNTSAILDPKKVSSQPNLCQYSLDDGNTWNNFLTFPQVLNNVKTIKFKCARYDGWSVTMYVSQSNTRAEQYDLRGYNNPTGAISGNFAITKDTTLYICRTEAVEG